MTAVTDLAADAFALLTDGSTVRICQAGPGDADAVRAMHATMSPDKMHATMSPDNMYLRFFSLSPVTAEYEAARVCRPADSRHAALLAWIGEVVVGVATYEVGSHSDKAEVAFAVADRGPVPQAASLT